uniref:Uncharacterized protein n=1 Tax=Oryza brachyantha TaxID=4533 RepID=J3MK11_ORYBR
MAVLDATSIELRPPLGAIFFSGMQLRVTTKHALDSCKRIVKEQSGSCYCRGLQSSEFGQFFAVGLEQTDQIDCYSNVEYLIQHPKITVATALNLWKRNAMLTALLNHYTIELEPVHTSRGKHVHYNIGYKSIISRKKEMRTNREIAGNQRKKMDKGVLKGRTAQLLVSMEYRKQNLQLGSAEIGNWLWNDPFDSSCASKGLFFERSKDVASKMPTKEHLQLGNLT